jgi:hypothetical protein
MVAAHLGGERGHDQAPGGAARIRAGYDEDLCFQVARRHVQAAATLRVRSIRGYRCRHIRRRLAGSSPPGRLFEPANAWGAIFLASGVPAGWLTPDARWRVRKLLDEHGLRGLAPRLRRRATRERYAAHPGVLEALSQRPEVVRTGVSAAAAVGLDLAGGNELDAYVSLGSSGALIAAYALEPAGIEGNVSLRVVNGSLWPFDARVAPRAVVALDLAEEADSRSARVGREALMALDGERLWAIGLGARSRPGVNFDADAAICEHLPTFAWSDHPVPQTSDVKPGADSLFGNPS